MFDVLTEQALDGVASGGNCDVLLLSQRFLTCLPASFKASSAETPEHRRASQGPSAVRGLGLRVEGGGFVVFTVSF